LSIVYSFATTNTKQANYKHYCAFYIFLVFLISICQWTVSLVFSVQSQHAVNCLL
jgi:hypothetical protein